ncbi:MULTISPECIES: hypothetical protein [Kosakonia]|uniref:DUF2767 domain-containing protein n=1 Tax=Kosakonia sacchari TaxID=1158459 RepID=A0ABZ0MJN5_9ENTR|nr:hypothetical protein [Kosakonia sacchari]WOZ75685.1 hypothetical protein Q8Y70_13770 [Kosakonia sacchari]
MASNNKREIALEQALIALLSAVKESNIDVDNLVKNANHVILNSAHKHNIIDDHDIRTYAIEIMKSFADKV